MDTRALPSSRASDTLVGERDHFIDLLRAVAFAVVVLWHWGLTTVSWTATGPHVGNPAADLPLGWLLTWVAQPMCVFFAVGGWLHSRDGRPAIAFWRARLARLLPPVLPLLAIAAAAWAITGAFAQPGLQRAVVLAVSPLWFLGVYLVLIALAPVARVAHRRWGWTAVVALATSVAVVDWWRIAGGHEGLGATLVMFVLTWATVHQLGFHLGTLRVDRRRAAQLCGGGLAGLWVLSTVGPYPAIMVGTAGEAISNMGPPNLMVVALACFQIGAVCLVAERAAAFADRHRSTLEVVARWTMPTYVWHLTAFTVVAGVALMLGVDNSTPDAAWWAVRPLWVVVPAAVCVPLCLLAGRRPSGSWPRVQGRGDQDSGVSTTSENSRGRPGSLDRSAGRRPSRRMHT